MLRDREIINGFDVERVLNDLPLDIIKENITTQVDDPLSYESDYCSDVFDTFDEAFEEFGHIEEYKHELNEIRDKFNLFVLNEIDRKFGLGIDYNSISDYEVENLAKNAYQFFIVEFREKVSEFILQYIISNKMMLSDMYDEDYRKKDVTTLNMKKKTKNRTEVIILSNLPNIISYILDQEHQPEEFIDLSSEAEEMVAEYIKNATMSFIISGNFVGNVLNEIKFAHNDTIDEIASSIRMELIDMIPDDDLNPDYIDDEE